MNTKCMIRSTVKEVRMAGGQFCFTVVPNVTLMLIKYLQSS